MKPKLFVGFETEGTQVIVLLFVTCLYSVCNGRDNLSRFTQVPRKPSFVTSGQNAPLSWKYHLSRADRQHFSKIEFGFWVNGNIRTPLITVTRTNHTTVIEKGSAFIRAGWIGNLTSRSAAFEMLNVTSKYSRQYWCSLYFKGRTSAVTDTVEVVVRGPPRIVQKSPNTIIRKGGRIVLLCDVEGDPKPLVTWYRGSHILQNSTSKTSYIIEHAALSTSGIYKCVVSDEAGSMFYEVMVSVTLPENEGNMHNSRESSDRSYPQGTHHVLISSICIGLVFFILLGAYAYFSFTSKRTKRHVKKRKPIANSNDEQTMSLIEDWSNYEDNGEKL